MAWYQAPSGRKILTAHRRNVHDPPRALRPHVRQDELGEMGEAEEVHLELVAGLVDGDVLDGPVEAEAGVVDEDVDPPFAVDDLANGPLVVGGLADVHLHGDDAVVGQLGEPVGPPGAGVHRVALPSHQDRRLPPYAGGCAGDQYDFAHCTAPFLGSLRRRVTLHR